MLNYHIHSKFDVTKNCQTWMWFSSVLTSTHHLNDVLKIKLKWCGRVTNYLPLPFFVGDHYAYPMQSRHPPTLSPGNATMAVLFAVTPCKARCPFAANGSCRHCFVFKSKTSRIILWASWHVTIVELAMPIRIYQIPAGKRKEPAAISGEP